jgi:beta-glucuronidase
MMYPQQNERRNMLDLSGFWQFRLDPEKRGEQEGWCDGLSQPRTIAVPASWNEQFQDTRDYLGTAWYARTFYVPPSWRDERICLRVGSANYAAQVWVNGQHVGAHEGGHLPFTLDVTEQLRWGEANLLVIQVDGALTPTRVPPGNVQRGLGGFMRGYPNTSFDFFPYTGLQRPVLLFSVPANRISDLTVVTEIEDGDGLVQLTVAQEGGTLDGQAVLSGQGTEWTSSLSFAAGSATATFTIPGARLWSPDDPYLYELAVTLLDGTEVIDRYTLEVGIRTVSVQGDRLLLNGEPIQLTGFGKHEDFPVHGRGLNVPLIVKDYALLKWVGANSYRTSHYPYSDEAMQLADREGILVVDEIPAVGLRFDDGQENVEARGAQCRQQIRELVARDKNHPSVIAWSVANEPFPANFMQRFAGGNAEEEDTDAVGTAFFSEMFDLTRQLDPTRPVTLVGVMGGPVDWLALSDVVFVNRYWGWYAQSGRPEQGAELLAQELDGLHETLRKPIVISEFGADTIPGMHSDPPEMWTEEYQVEFLRHYLDVAAQRPFVVGLHVWNFADFKTGQSTGRAGGMNHKGVFTRDRRPKMAAHFLRERWVTQEPARTESTVQARQPAAQPAPESTVNDALQALVARIREQGPQSGKVISLDIQGEGTYTLFVAGEQSRVEEGLNDSADVTLRLDARDAVRMFTGQLNPMIAFTTGKIQVQGDARALAVLASLR